MENNKTCVWMNEKGLYVEDGSGGLCSVYLDGFCMKKAKNGKAYIIVDMEHFKFLKNKNGKTYVKISPSDEFQRDEHKSLDYDEVPDVSLGELDDSKLPF